MPSINAMDLTTGRREAPVTTLASTAGRPVAGHRRPFDALAATSEFRPTEGRIERLPELAADLARQNCDVVLVPARKRDLSRSSRRSGNTPIVIVANDYDPVGTGHIASLAHPRGRITRVSQLWPERAMREAKVARAFVE